MKITKYPKIPKPHPVCPKRAAACSNIQTHQTVKQALKQTRTQTNIRTYKHTHTLTYTHSHPRRSSSPVGLRSLMKRGRWDKRERERRWWWWWWTEWWYKMVMMISRDDTRHCRSAAVKIPPILGTGGLSRHRNKRADRSPKQRKPQEGQKATVAG